MDFGAMIDNPFENDFQIDSPFQVEREDLEDKVIRGIVDKRIKVDFATGLIEVGTFTDRVQKIALDGLDTDNIQQVATAIIDKEIENTTFISELNKVSTESIDKLAIDDEENDYGDLTVEYVKGLLLNDEIIGYRIRTNKGLFDMSLKTARKLGLYNYRVTKGIKVQKYDKYGKYMSQSEHENQITVPDISDNAELCRQIIMLILT